MFGAPSGARVGVYGSQSGTESRTSSLIVPLNGLRAMVFISFFFIESCSVTKCVRSIILFPASAPALYLSPRFTETGNTFWVPGPTRSRPGPLQLAQLAVPLSCVARPNAAERSRPSSREREKLHRVFAHEEHKRKNCTSKHLAYSPSLSATSPA